MAKFRFISMCGDGLAVGLDMSCHGHQVDCWIKDKTFYPVFDGLLPRVDAWNQKLTKDILFIADFTGNGKIMDKLRDGGYKSWGGGIINDKLEDDRLFAYETAKKAGLLIPDYEYFTDFKKGIKFIESTKDDDIYVFKPCTLKASKSWTYMAKSKDDMLTMLAYYENKWQENIKDSVSFILQKKVEGLQACIESWYCNGERVPNFFNFQIETKKFLYDDQGPSTGCESTLSKFVDKNNLMAKELIKLDGFAKENKLNSPFDINAIVNKNGEVYFLEFTPRFGYSSTFALMQTLKDSGYDIGTILATLASGAVPQIEPIKDWCGCVKASTPPYPNEDGLENSRGKPIDIDCDIDNVWLQDVMVEDDELVCAGTFCGIVEITKTGDIDEIEKSIYKQIEQCNIPEKMYRKDGIKVLKKRLDELTEWGYIK